jgi:hypothetical protein
MQALSFRLGLPVLAAVPLAGYGWWVTGLPSFTWLTYLAVVGAGLAAFGAGRYRQFRAACLPRWDRGAAAVPRGAEVWVVIVALFAGWELAAWAQSPRADHPTISSMLDSVLGSQPLRAALFVGWFVIGYRLGRR